MIAEYFPSHLEEKRVSFSNSTIKRNVHEWEYRVYWRRLQWKKRISGKKFFLLWLLWSKLQKWTGTTRKSVFQIYETDHLPIPSMIPQEASFFMVNHNKALVILICEQIKQQSVNINFIMTVFSKMFCKA